MNKVKNQTRVKSRLDPITGRETERREKMRKVSMVLCGVLLFSFSGMVSAAQQFEKNTITVTGKARVNRKPDICYITLYVKGDGILLVDAVKKADRIVAEIEKAIKEKHKEAKKIEVTEFGLGEKQRRYWSSEQKDEPPRPEAIKRIRIEIPPTPSVAHEVVDTAIRSGAIMKTPSDVHYPGRIESVVVYGLLNASALEDEARKKATEDAMKKAKGTAALVQKKIGKVVSIGCSGSWPQRVFYSPERQDFPIKHIGIDPEKIVVSHSITITFELLDQ